MYAETENWAILYTNMAAMAKVSTKKQESAKIINNTTSNFHNLLKT